MSCTCCLRENNLRTPKTMDEAGTNVSLYEPFHLHNCGCGIAELQQHSVKMQQLQKLFTLSKNLAY